MLVINILLSVICAGDVAQFNTLTPEENRVIVNKGTEHPFTGAYYKNFTMGIYRCKRCDAPLYRSENKFESGCGWPSFDSEIADAVQRVPDADNIRTEILCAHCGAHLGHVFLGEGFTSRNTRHCVNSISLNFTPDQKKQEKGKIHNERAIFAAGCFWGVEYFFREAPGVLKTRVGYTGGNTQNPTYQEVCSDSTGHAEAIEILYDPSRTSYEILARLFFEIHDPSQQNRQGPDMGSQYRSAIFYISEEQKVISIRLIKELREKGFAVVTQVTKANVFWPAELYHQKYYSKKKGHPYCHVYQKRF